MSMLERPLSLTHTHTVVVGSIPGHNRCSSSSSTHARPTTLLYISLLSSFVLFSPFFLLLYSLLSPCLLYPSVFFFLSFFLSLRLCACVLLRHTHTQRERERSDNAAMFDVAQTSPALLLLHCLTRRCCVRACVHGQQRTHTDTRRLQWQWHREKQFQPTRSETTN